MHRIQKLQEVMKANQIDEMLISDTTSIYYLIKQEFDPQERFLALLVRQQDKPILLLNRLFVAKESSLFDIYPFFDGDDSTDILLHQLQGKRIGIDKNLPAKFLLPLMKAACDREFVIGSFMVDSLRLIKDEEERQAMRAASSLNDQIMKEVESFLKVGIHDKEVEDFIYSLHKKYQVQASFPPIVAFKNTASDPHGSANNQILQQEDVVVIDMGIKLNHYCSDMTRTFVFNHPQMQEIYQIVKKANLAAFAKVKAGARFCDVDKAAREVIQEAGYGEYFTHRTGHGIGLNVHEPMDVNENNTALLQEGMCFSIEPGIYLPNKGGVRIEDLVIVTSEGAEVLNHYPK